MNRHQPTGEELILAKAPFQVKVPTAEQSHLHEVRKSCQLAAYQGTHLYHLDPRPRRREETLEEAIFHQIRSKKGGAIHRALDEQGVEEEPTEIHILEKITLIKQADFHETLEGYPGVIEQRGKLDFIPFNDQPEGGQLFHCDEVETKDLKRYRGQVHQVGGAEQIKLRNPTQGEVSACDHLGNLPPFQLTPIDNPRLQKRGPVYLPEVLRKV